MKEKWTRLLPVALMIVLALTRWPGLMPPNFSAVYALAFCAGVFFPRPLAYWLPLGTLVVSDLALNVYYAFALHIDAFSPMQFINYAVYAGIIWLGTQFGSRASLLKLVSGGVLGALAFYLITNTAAWLFNPFQNPEYTKTFAGWLIALTKGTAGWPATWEFFRNTLLSGGLFTALFAGAVKLSEALDQSQTEKAEDEIEDQPVEEAKT